MTLPAAVLVLKRLGKERFECSLVRAWVNGAHEDEAVEWVRRGGRGMRLHLGLGLDLGGGYEGGRWVRSAHSQARLDPGDAFQSLRVPPRPRGIVYR